MVLTWYKIIGCNYDLTKAWHDGRQARIKWEPTEAFWKFISYIKLPVINLLVFLAGVKKGDWSSKQKTAVVDGI